MHVIFEQGANQIVNGHPQSKVIFAQIWANTFEAAANKNCASFLNNYFPNGISLLINYAKDHQCTSNNQTAIIVNHISTIVEKCDSSMMR